VVKPDPKNPAHHYLLRLPEDTATLRMPPRSPGVEVPVIEMFLNL
jgi:hypothetical protein